uniref:DNA (cytosine-5-)-methyltransferase n=1 Tax=Moniliophthora roreri TaxID=221103 RepID=A0A0W0FSQ2_MONRR
MPRNCSLNIDKDYCPHWTPVEGLREVLQNWHDGMIASYGLKGPEQLKVVEARRRKQNGKTIRRFNASVDGKPETVGYIEYRFWEKQEGTVKNGEKSNWKVDDDSEEVDDDDDDEDYIEYTGSPTEKTGRRSENELIIINKNASIEFNKLRQGKTTKAADSSGRFIGKYGDGMKVGIVAMLRENYSVVYHTCRYRWKFYFFANRKFPGSMDELWVEVTNDEKEKATYNCDKDTRVSIKGVPLDIAFHAFDNALFCCPPPQDAVIQVASAPTGRIIIGDKYSSRLFGSSIFICDFPRDDEGSPFLELGYDIRGGISCSRDRNNPNIREVTTKITKIWRENLVEEADRRWVSSDSDAPFSRAYRYLQLLELEGVCMDVAGVHEGFAKGKPDAPKVVKHIFQAYLSRLRKEYHGSAFWIYNPRAGSRDDDSPSKIIQSMGMTPVLAPETLIKLFEEHNLVISPQAKRKEVFMALPDSMLLNSTETFSRYVVHAIRVIQEYVPFLRNLKLVWKDTVTRRSTVKQEEEDEGTVGHTQVNIKQEEDEVKPKSEQTKLRLDLDVFIHKDSVFLNDRNLSLHDVHSIRRNCPEYLVRSGDDDHICNCSVRVLAIEMVEQTHSSRESRIRAIGDCMDLLFLFPHGDTGELVVSWRTFSSSKGFLVEVRPQGSFAQTKTLKRAVVNLVHESDHGSPAPQDLAQVEDGAAAELDDEITFLTTSDTSVSVPARFSGQKISMQVCSSRHDISVAYSLPFEFEYPLDQVRDLVTQIRDQYLFLSFSPVDGADRYLLVVTFTGGETEACELKESDWSKEIGPRHPVAVSLTAVSAAGVRSHSEATADVKYPSLDAGLDLRQEERDNERSICDGGGMPAGFDDSDDDMDESFPANTAADIPIRTTNHRAGSAALPVGMDTEELYNFEEGFNAEVCAKSLADPSYSRDPAAKYVELGVARIGSNGTEIRSGAVVEVVLNVTGRFRHFLLCVESVCRRETDPEVRLRSQKYISRHDFLDPTSSKGVRTFTSYEALLHGPGDIEFFLVPDPYTYEALCEIKLGDIESISCVFHQYDRMKPEDGTIPRFRCSSAVCFPSNAVPMEHTLPLRLLLGTPEESTPQKPTNVTIGNFKAGAGSFSQGFCDAGWVTTFAVDGDMHACNTNKRNHPTTLIHQSDVGVLLSEYTNQYLPKPTECLTVVLISLPSDLLPHIAKDGQAAKHCVDILKVTGACYMLIESGISAVHPEFIYHWHQLAVDLRDAGMQSHWTVLDAQDYGAPISQKSVFLIAAKIGLTLPSFPSPTHGNKVAYTTVRDAIADLAIDNPRKMNSIGNPVFLCKREHKQYACSMGAHDLVENHAILDSSLDLKNGQNTKWDEPCGVLRSECIVHPDGKRLLSPRELARIKTFKDDYVFTGPVSEQKKQIINAVCPILSRAFGETFKAAVLQDNGDLRGLFTNRTMLESSRTSKRGISELDGISPDKKRLRLS